MTTASPDPEPTGQQRAGVRRTREVFHFLTWAWDIDLARHRTTGYPVHTVDITPLAGFSQLIVTSADLVATADLSVPILIAPIPGDHGYLVIDGWHRLKRALGEHVTHLPALLLTHDDEQACRLRGTPPTGHHTARTTRRPDRSRPAPG